MLSNCTQKEGKNITRGVAVKHSDISYLELCGIVLPQLESFRKNTFLRYLPLTYQPVALSVKSAFWISKMIFLSSPVRVWFTLFHVPKQVESFAKISILSLFNTEFDWISKMNYYWIWISGYFLLMKKKKKKTITEQELNSHQAIFIFSKRSVVKLNKVAINTSNSQPIFWWTMKILL